MFVSDRCSTTDEFIFRPKDSSVVLHSLFVWIDEFDFDRRTL